MFRAGVPAKIGYISKRSEFLMYSRYQQLSRPPKPDQVYMPSISLGTLDS